MEPCHLLKLPDEIHVAVAELLPPNALKAARATCRKLNTIASPYLYPVLYLSCHQLDLDVFRLVAGNPLLISGVKELVIDDTTLSPRLADWEVYKTVASYPHMWPDRKKAYRWPKKFDEEGRIWSDEPDKEFHDLFNSILQGHHENRQSHADIVALKQALPLFKSLQSLVISNRTADDDFDFGAQSEESRSPVVKTWRRVGESKRERPPFPPRCDWIAPWHEPGFRTEVMQLDFFNDELDKAIRDYGLPPPNGEETQRDSQSQTARGTPRGIPQNWLEEEETFHCVVGREARAIALALEALDCPSIRLNEFRVDASAGVGDGSIPVQPGEDSLAQGNVARILASMSQLKDLLLEPHGMAIFSAIPDDVTFRQLEHVEFSCGEMDPQKLVGFIQRHASTIKFLTIQHCSIDLDLFEESWEEVMIEIRRIQDAKALDLYDGLVAGVYDGEPCQGCGRNGTLGIDRVGWLIRHWEFVFFSFWRQYHEYPWDLVSDEEEEEEGSEDDAEDGDEDGEDETSEL